MMPRGERRWSGQGTWTREIFIHADGVLDVDTESAIPEFQPLLPYLKAANADAGEVVVEFSVRGWHTPASMYGGSDRMGWAEEGDEERTIDQIYLLVDIPKKPPEKIQDNPLDDYEDEFGYGSSPQTRKKIKIPDAIADPILTKFDSEIEETEYEADEPDFESVIKTVSEIITEDINVTN